MPGFTFFRGLRAWWREGLAQLGLRRTAQQLLTETWYFLRESTPSRRRQRFGDIGFDLDHRVNTTSARLPLRTRLRGLVTSPYQPTDPALFREIMQALDLDWPAFTFLDLGSGKGRALLMAAAYPFRSIVGVEILPELHQFALENIHKADRAARIEALCGDARELPFPNEPLVVYLFNPLSEPGLARVIAKLDASLREAPRPVYVVYHNPEHEHLLARSAALKKLHATCSYVIYAADVISKRS